MATWRITTLQSLVDVFFQPWFLVFAIPIFGAISTPIFGRCSSTLRNYFSISTIGISTIIAGYLVVLGTAEEHLILFVPTVVNNSTFDFFHNSINLDALGVFIAFIASSLGFLIAVFSLEYMKDDKAQGRYYFFIQLFIGGMVLLVLAGDLIFLYSGWKIVGVCSYFLIGHWFHKPDPQGSLCAKSGMKAFLMTLIGDIAILIALGILWLETNTVNIKIITTNFNSAVASELQTFVALLILLGTISKSAQFPFITWLSSSRNINIDAMQGPTTVSAFIHAATMVKAGVYLMSRFYKVFAPANITFFIIFITLIAVITALVAAASALTSIDIKRVLAYSTISQLAYMFMGLSIGYLAYTENPVISIEGFMGTQFHLLSHAIFKALLFLSAGAIIHSLNEERNIKCMGGLKNELPIIHWSTLIGICALAGIPFFFNGGYSKEAILSSIISFSLSDAKFAFFGWIIYGAGMITALLTSLYSFRFFFLIFYGERPEGLKVHKPGSIMRGVTFFLAILVVLTGFIGPTFLNNHFKPMFKNLDYHNPLVYIPDITHHPLAFINMIIVIGLIVIGFILSYRIYYKGPRTIMSTVQKNWALNACHTIIVEGFYLDTIYNEIIDLFMRLNWKLRKLQTGDLNFNMAEISLVAITIIIILLLF
ncbi:MAG: NADH-quinone oxidoreductase subunit L [Candidatus Hodarchaeota archaeon]